MLPSLLIDEKNRADRNERQKSELLHEETLLRLVGWYYNRDHDELG